MTVRLTIPGNPLPKGRPRFVRGRAVTPKKTREWEKRVRSHAWAQMLESHTKALQGRPVEVTLAFYRKDRRRCDLDNLIKAVLDALNGVAFADDSQVVKVSAERHIDADNPRVEITITAA